MATDNLITDNIESSGNISGLNGTFTGTLTVPDGSISGAKILGIPPSTQTALNTLDIQGGNDLVNAQPFVSKKISAWDFSNSPPVRLLNFGDSFATNLQRGPKMARAGLIGLGTTNRSGVTDLVGQFTNGWTNGKLIRIAVGGNTEWTAGGSAAGDIRGSTAFVAYIKKSGGGTFVLQSASGGLGNASAASDAGWTTLATIDTSNATTIGATNTYALSTSNLPFYRLRIKTVSVGNVDIVATGIYNSNGGGVIEMPICDGVGHQVTEAITCPPAIFNPIWAALAPDLIISSWLDPSAAWQAGGAFRTFYASATAAFASTDWVQLGPNPIDTSVPENAPPSTDLLTDMNSAQREWAVSTKQSWINGFNYLRDFPTANARGLMADNKHLSAAGQAYRNDHLWSILPVGNYGLGAEMMSGGIRYVETIGSGSLNTVPLQINRPVILTQAISIRDQSVPLEGNRAWQINNPAGNLEISTTGSSGIILGISSNLGAHPGYNGAMLGGLNDFRWRGAFGGVSMGYRAITADRTLDITDHTINATTSPLTITLPAATTTPTAAGYTGRIFRLLNNGAGMVTISGTVDGIASPTIAPGAKLTIQSTGSAWISL